MSSEAAAAEVAAVKRLCEAGHDAFVNSSASTFKGGVCVRVAFLDDRIEWTSKRPGGAPVGFMFSETPAGFLLHAGRADGPSGMTSLVEFLARLQKDCALEA